MWFRVQNGRGDWSSATVLPPLPSHYNMPKPSGVTFNRYAAIAGRVLRKALKEDKRVNAQRADVFELRVASWKDGHQGDAKVLNVPLKSASE